MYVYMSVFHYTCHTPHKLQHSNVHDCKGFVICYRVPYLSNNQSLMCKDVTEIFHLPTTAE